jgi:uncharacterized repeat protein (TIGR01451 family)
LIGLVVLLMTAGTDAAGAADGAHAAQVVRSGQSIRICHATGSGGFVIQEPDIDSIIDGTGHGGHARDIIPPFDWSRPTNESGHYPGRNWDDVGQAIWNNGCVRPRPPDARIAVHVACVDVNANGTYDARFGYTSGSTVTIAVGENNRFSPGDEDRGQITEFNEGYVLDAFEVAGVPVGTSLTWSVTSGGTTSTATASASFGLRCTPEPPDNGSDLPVGVFVTCVTNHGSTYDAVFGYDNENADATIIPISDANSFSPPPVDRGQPTVFTPGRNEQAVTVTGIPADVDLTWTVAWVGTISAQATSAFETKCPDVPEPPPAGPLPSPPPRALGIFATCVTKHGSRFDATFGYVNQNIGVVNIPIGERNAVSPGRAGRGQPEFFSAGFVSAAFTVRGIRNSRAVTWTVRFGNQVRVARATASLPRCLTASVDPVARAAVRKTVRPRTVMVGERVRFTILTRNRGSEVLRPAVVRDTLVGGRLRILSARSGLGSCRVTRVAGSRRVRCSARRLAPGQAFIVRITARAVAPGVARDRARVSGLPRSVARAAVRVLAPPPPVTG